MKALRRKMAIPALAVGSVTLLIAGVLLGLQVAVVGFLPGFPDLGRLDYSAGPPGGFAPLDSQLVNRLLGSSGADAASTARRPGLVRQTETPIAAAAGRGQLASGPSLPTPVVVAHVFTNDDFANAYRVPSLPYTAKTDTSSATREQAEPASCSPLGGKTAWYAFTSTRDVGLLADTFGTNSASALTVYAGASLRDLQPVPDAACSSDAQGNALVAFAAAAGVTYYFQVDGPVGGPVVFTLQEQGVTTRASVGSDRMEGDGASVLGIISQDGRQVLMASGSSTFDTDQGTRICLPPQQQQNVLLPCGKVGVYVRDRVRHSTVNGYPAESAAIAGTQLGSIAAPGTTSANGRYFVFWTSVSAHTPGSDTRTPSSPYRFEVYRHDNLTKHDDLVSLPRPGGGKEANGSSGRAEISDDGRFVAFVSWADNLVTGDTNKVRDVFIRDMVKGTTALVDVSSAGAPANGMQSDPSAETPGGDHGADLFSMSSDARYVVFKSSATNLVPHDTNRHTDVFVRDRLARTTVRVNLSPTGEQAGADTRSVLGLGLRTISDDGRFVFFNSDATNLVDPPTAAGVENVYRRDLQRGVTTLVTVSSTGERANSGVRGGAPDRLAFTYLAPILVAGGADVGLSELSYSATRDGRFVVFNSEADNLVHGDSNQLADIFLHDVGTGTTTRVSVSSKGHEGRGGPCGSPTISVDGRFVAFDCTANNLVDGDNNNTDDVFVRELPGPRPLTGWY